MSRAPVEQVSWREVLSREHGAALAIICLGVWLHAADSLLVSTMMPAIVAEIGGIPFIPWTVALYEIGSIVMGAASGLLTLRLGLRRPMTAAACVFAAGCAASALAPEMWLLLVGRLLQGLGGGGLMALSFVSAGLLFPKRLIARVMGAVSTVWAVSAFLGPLVGGLFVEFATWRAGFWFFAAQALLLALWLATRREDATRPAGESAGRRFPVIRLLCFTAAGIAVSLYVPFVITRLHGVSALTAGYVIAVEAVAWAVVAALLSGTAERHDPKMIVTGFFLVTLSLVGFAVTVPSGPIWAVALCAALQGAGFGSAWTFILRRATAIAPPGEAQQVAGAIPTVQRLGYALGAAYLGIVANAAGIETAAGDSLGFVASAVFLACLPPALLGLVAAARFVTSAVAEGD